MCSGFVRAMEELEKHKKMLKEKAYEMEEEDDEDDSLSRSDINSEHKMTDAEEEDSRDGR